MFCEKCGTEIIEGAKFCVKCGAKVEDMLQDEKPERAASEEYHVKEAASSGENMTERKESRSVSKSDNEQSKRNKLPKLYVGIAAIAIVIVIIAFFSAKGGGKTIDLNDYLLEPEYAGYDGYASVSNYGFNSAAFIKDYEDKIGFSPKYKKSDTYALYGDEISAAEVLTYFIGGSMSQSGNLSNGDEIKYSWSFYAVSNEELSELFTYKISCSDVTYTVSGLEEIGQVDIFADIELDYSGLSPSASVTVVNNSTVEGISSLIFEVAPSDGLANGDTVTVSISESAGEGIMSLYGIAPAEYSKDYTVENLDSYITLIDDIPNDMMEELKTQSESVISSHVANNWDSSYSTLTDASYLGCYFLTPKDEDLYANVWDYATTIYMVYKLQDHIQYEDSGFDTTTDVYFFVKFYDPIMLADGTASIDTSNYTTCESFGLDGNTFSVAYEFSRYIWSDTTTLYFYGYESLDSLFNNCVTKNVADYNYESTVEETSDSEDVN